MDKHTTSATPSTPAGSRLTPTDARCAHRSHPVLCGQCQLDRWRVLADRLRAETAPEDNDELSVRSDGAQARTGLMEGYVTVDVDSFDEYDPASASICLEPLAAVTLARHLLDTAVEAYADFDGRE